MAPEHVRGQVIGALRRLSAAPGGADFSPVSRIARHASTTPGRPAVVDGATVLSYSELDGRAEALARRLEAAGVGPGGCVGLLFDRSREFVVAALAVLKTGAAYLPMDSATPPDRGAFILANAGAQVLLSHRGKARRWPAGSWRLIETAELIETAGLIGLDRPPGLAGLPGGNTPGAPQPAARRGALALPAPDSLAYVIYTSGSTGRPKGVEITHANLANLVEWHLHAFGVSSDDRASQVAGLGFDAAVWEIWPHLAAGCAVHIAGEQVRRSPSALRDWLLKQEITISFVPTVLAEQLLHTPWPEHCALRVLLTGADTLHGRPTQKLPFVLVNNYGPTECTVVATSGPVAARPGESDRPSIGRPILRTRALLLDERLDEVAPGEPGELYLSGALVGRGYRNNPELTAASFVTLPLPDGGEVRAYRTGDRVRLLTGGELEFLGRTDDQVKIRGYRVELGEVTTWLNRCPGVAAASAAVHDAAAGRTGVSDSMTERDPRLVGYIVPAQGADPSPADIRRYLAARLPDYLVPTNIVTLTALPTTANGKIDRSALPAPHDPAPDSQAVPPSEPGTDLQPSIAALVSALLRRPEIGLNENFFLAGGHSMLGVQLVMRLRQSFGVTLTLRQLFGRPTVAALAAEVGHLLSQPNPGAEKVSR